MADPPDAGKRRIVTLESGTDRDQLAAARRLTTPTFPPPLNRPRSVFATWWAAWTTRHTVAVAVAAPTLFAAYRSIAFAPDTLVWTVVIAAIALAAATTFASSPSSRPWRSARPDRRSVAPSPGLRSRQWA